MMSSITELGHALHNNARKNETTAIPYGDKGKKMENKEEMVTWQVTVHQEDDGILGEKAEDGIYVIAKPEDSDMEDGGCDVTPISHLKGHQMNSSAAHQMSPTGNSSSDNTVTRATSCEITANVDLCGNFGSFPLYLKQPENGVQRSSASEVSTNEIAKLGHNYTDENSFNYQFSKKMFFLQTQCEPQCEETHKTNFCENTPRSTSSINEMHEMTGISEEVLKCHFCEKLFRGEYKRRRHEMTHTREKPFNCQFCKKSFRKKYNCDKHEMTHTGEKSYKCLFCEKAFIWKQDCRRHEKTHTDERLFKCHFCEEFFFGKRERKLHERTTHVGERYMKCRFCEKSFIRKRERKRHEVIHKSEILYSLLT